MDKQDERLKKSERLCSKKRIDLLFGTGGSHAMTAFPLKAVYRLTDSVPASSSPDGDPETASVQMMVSVPKRHFRRAVKRNRVKRQLREAYRKNKHSIVNKVNSLEGMSLMITFIWMESKLYDSKTVEQKIKNLLQRIEEKVRHEKGREQTIQP